VQIALKRLFTGEMFAFYRKSGSLNQFPVKNLQPEVELMHPLCSSDIIVTNVACNGVTG